MAETKPQQLFTESQIEEFRHAFEFFDKVRDITFIFVYHFTFSKKEYNTNGEKM